MIARIRQDPPTEVSINRKKRAFLLALGAAVLHFGGYVLLFRGGVVRPGVTSIAILALPAWIIACRELALAKGRDGALAWLGLLTFIGFAVVALLPEKPEEVETASPGASSKPKMAP